MEGRDQELFKQLSLFLCLNTRIESVSRRPMAGSSVASPKPSTSSSSVSKKRKATEEDRFSSFLSSNNNNDNDNDNDDNNDDDVEVEEEEEQQIGGSPSSFPKQKPLPAHLLPKHLASTSSSSSSKKAVKQPGLIYLSRIPPGMGPGKVKHLLSQFGEVGRIYLARADANKGKPNSLGILTTSRSLN